MAESGRLRKFGAESGRSIVRPSMNFRIRARSGLSRSIRDRPLTRNEQLSGAATVIYTSTSLSSFYLDGGARETLDANALFSPGLPVQRYFGSVKRVCRNPVCCSRLANSSRAASIAGRCSTAQLWSTCSGTISDLPRSVSS
jgi:hypothetical protein